MIDGRLLVDAHLHPPRLSTLKPAWTRWAEQYGAPGWRSAFDGDGVVIPSAFDELLAAEGVDRAILLCEYSPKVTGIQPVEDLLPIVEHNPGRFAFLANVNPHLHHPIAAELLRQVGLGAIGLKIHPVHGGFSPADPMLYPAYQVCAERGLPVVVHCGTSTFPGSSVTMGAPELLGPVLRDFPGLTLVLAHGGRGWWYDQAAFLALMHDDVWIELSGLPPARLPDYYQRFDLRRLARAFVFATDWPGVPGIARNARALARLGLDDETLDLVLGGNAMRIYFGSSTQG
ncbi:amidohydrolase [Nonomuraea deserti]|uniref:Amidohydrolase n=1 Tax=Nonomuraea deserti TaxID=1848322 RepID=A0A4R4VNL5_9ACTN|nr:amidohydrolase family protein [Nonomuraea deserti]TDD04663.1 amidohydrolase [Nonomuraea deserti]